MDKRIKVKVNVRRNFIQGGDFEQGYIAEFVQMDHICESCCRIHANPDQWVAVVQIRQHVSHRKTFFYLEQLILKHNAAVQAIRIKQMSEGIDFCFASESHALKFLDFVGNVVPIKSRKDKQLVSHDRKTNNYNYKCTFSVKIVPICREDLICLPHEVSVSLGNLVCEIHSTIEVNVGGSKYALADVEVARLSDFGKNNIIFTVKTHIGHLLNPGDQALGYDVYGANINDLEFGKYKRLDLPGVVLIKKKRNRRGKPRKWKLKSMNMEAEDLCKKIDKEKLDTEYEEFLKDLEENPELRFNISLYRNKAYQPSEVASNTERVDVPISLEELLADLGISDEE
ncbi:hypothetical protein IFM89_030332 [Coptis chinensis]|uniref:60S ribosomal export protein NMD3 n=1 Tax=Coptis chinensis TaxID=261450 RepID=A0A835ICT5_9MAGN|nr:hypothetical protein IFM89_030332 [Coptis chinensis]